MITVDIFYGREGRTIIVELIRNTSCIYAVFYITTFTREAQQ